VLYAHTKFHFQSIKICHETNGQIPLQGLIPVKQLFQSGQLQRRVLIPLFYNEGRIPFEAFWYTGQIRKQHRELLPFWVKSLYLPQKGIWVYPFYLLRQLRYWRAFLLSPSSVSPWRTCQITLSGNESGKGFWGCRESSSSCRRFGSPCPPASQDCKGGMVTNNCGKNPLN